MSGPIRVMIDNSYRDHIKSYGNEDIFSVNTTKSDTEFLVNINGMTVCIIKITNGYIGAKAVAIQKSKLTAKFGVVELKIKKEAIGQLYLKVDVGVIIDNSNLIAINSFGFTGFEGIFKGDLIGQTTEIQVRAGAIVCTIW
jgi:hypothetical protein